MDEQSLPFDKAIIIGKIEYLIVNLYIDPDNIFKTIFQLVDEHKLTELKDTLFYFYELLFCRGYTEYADEFARRYDIDTRIVNGERNE